MDKGHRWFAAMYDRLTGPTERRLERHRQFVVGEARGRVLEIGVGTGASLPYYRQAESVVATEPDPYMLRRAEERLAELGLSNVELRQAPAEALAFDDRSFDTVVSTLVLCTVGDLSKALAEVKRVLKPEGTFRFIEHVRSDGRFVGTVQDVVVPVWRWFGAGCNLNRRTQRAIEEAGFAVEELRRLRLGPGFPAIVGVARPG